MPPAFDVAAILSNPDAVLFRKKESADLLEWLDLFSVPLWFFERGVDPATAASLGSFIVSTVEGAIIQCRSSRSVQPLDDAYAGLMLLLRHVGAD